MQTALEEVTTSRHLNLFLPRIVFTRSICRRFPCQPLHFCSSLAAEFVCDAVRVYSFSLPLPHVHTPSLRPRGFSFRLVATRQRSLLRRVHLLQYDLTEKPERPFVSFKTFAVRFLTLVPVTNLRRQSTAPFVLIERLGLMLLFPPKFIRTIFGRFWNHFTDSNSNFGGPWKLFQKQFDFCLFKGSITCNVTVHVHELWLVFTHVLIRCRHTAVRHSQTTCTAQAHHTSIPTVVVFLDDS